MKIDSEAKSALIGELAGKIRLLCALRSRGHGPGRVDFDDSMDTDDIVHELVTLIEVEPSGLIDLVDGIPDLVDHKPRKGKD